MVSAVLPPHPSLPQYKKQAKDLLKTANSGDPQAIQRMDANLPNGKLSEAHQNGADFALSDAQLVIAREHGFESWPKFVKQIESQNGSGSKAAIWQTAETAVISGDVSTLERLLRENDKMFRDEEPPQFGPQGLRPNYSAGEARAILIQNHEFENWEQFQEYTKARADKDAEVHEFEAASDAIAAGDLTTLEALLRRNPKIVRARSTRKHHSTLLHYIGANGIEYYRQLTPKNAVQIAEALIDAGADVNAEADMYGGGCDTLGLVATSIHPVKAGLQQPLMELLLAHGATIKDAGAVNGCLANGRGEAAEFMANHGAPLDLEGAAGVGKLDIVKSFFMADGSWKPGATKDHWISGFAWACEYGRTAVVEFMLAMGMDVNASLRNHGNSGLHWAAHCAHLETAKALLRHNADVNAKDKTWGSTPLGWALHGWGDPPPSTPLDRYYGIVKLLIASGATVEPKMLESDAVRADPRMMAALNLGPDAT